MNNDILHKLQQVESIMNQGALDLALEMLEQLCKQYPDNYHVVSLLGECYLAIGQPDKAIKPLKWAAEKRPAEEEESENSLPDREPDTIGQLKKKLGDKTIDDPWVDQYLLGCAYGRCMKFQSAIRHLNIANRMNPENTEVIRNIGWIRCMQKKKQLGRKLLRKAISLDPQNALAYNDLGASYLFENELAEAQKWIEKATQMDPEDEFISNTAERLEEMVAMKMLFGKKS